MSKWGLIDQTTEGRLRLFFPHFMDNRVPLDPEQNYTWRCNAFSSKPADQRVLRKMCSEDLLFWTTGFGSIYDAGDESGRPGQVPFIPYEYQIEVFALLWSAMYDKRCQIRVKKPRRMGATWQVVALFQHCWQFMGERQMLIGSYRETEVDGNVATRESGKFVGSWSKLLLKFDYMQIYQPKWLLPNGFEPRKKPHRMANILTNPETGAIIEGTTAASQSGHSERGWAAWWDEAAKTPTLYDILEGLAAYSPCRIWTSTIGDLSHPFSTILRDSPTIIQVPLSWDMNPEYTEGLTVDPQTGQKTSPWLQQRLNDINHDPQTANRVYYALETFQIGQFYKDALTTMYGSPAKPGTLRPPVRRGELVLNDDNTKVVGWSDQSNGRWKLWVDLERDWRWPTEVPVVWGADIAAGTSGGDSGMAGKSNSVLVLVHHETLEVVASFVTHGLVPYEFAQACAAALRWIGGEIQEPFGSFESNGPGSEFGDILRTRCGYQEIHSDNKAPSSKGAATKFGWQKYRDEATLKWFALHRQMIAERTFIERDEDCAAEMREYQNDPGGTGPPIYLPAMKTPDPSGARENHGDRTVARVVAIVAATARPFGKEEQRTRPPVGSYDYFQAIDQESADNERPIILRRAM